MLISNYEHVMDANKSRLTGNAGTHGITMLGDGATIKRKPLFNVLAATYGNPPAVLSVHDCTKHLAGG